MDALGLGYFDDLKGRVAILSISNSIPIDDSYRGQGYLGLYSYVSGGLSSKTNIERLWIHESPSNYVVFDEWLEEKKPMEYR